MTRTQAIEAARDRAFQHGRTYVVYFDLEAKEYFVVELGIDVELPCKRIGEYS